GRPRASSRPHGAPGHRIPGEKFVADRARRPDRTADGAAEAIACVGGFRGPRGTWGGHGRYGDA
ncbi:hypothetical protein, partial [Streptomyces shenzhenensis]|uniref:hypothetical protein n=1 Tax=Streptomyces shenzhenensis TaxID=943815 RepID=UPI0036C7FAEE